MTGSSYCALAKGKNSRVATNLIKSGSNCMNVERWDGSWSPCLCLRHPGVRCVLCWFFSSCDKRCVSEKPSQNPTQTKTSNFNKLHFPRLLLILGGKLGVPVCLFGNTAVEFTMEKIFTTVLSLMMNASNPLCQKGFLSADMQPLLLLSLHELPLPPVTTSMVVGGCLK